MRNYKKKIAAAAAGTLLLVTVAYAATAGSKDDPLVTLSYLNNVFAPKLESSAKDAATAQKNQMTQQMNNSLADWEQRVNEQLANGGQGSAVGSGQHEYSQRLGDDEFSTHTFSGTGVAPCMAANRISYFFDIDGPSVVTDAACASSVYAAHVAVSALRNHECEAAFVGSSSLNLGPGGWIVLEKTG